MPRSRASSRRGARSASLSNALQDLETVGLIRAVSDAEPTFTFKHVLTQESSYQGLLLEKRRSIHGQVARAYEALFPHQRDEHAALLATHYLASGDLDRALENAVRAGDAAARLHAHAEAGELYALAVDAAAAMPSPPESLTAIYQRRGRSLELAAKSSEALETYRQMEQVALNLGDQKMEVQAVLAQAVLHATPTVEFEQARGLQLANKVLEMATALIDRAAEAKALWILMILHQGDPLRGVAYGERAIAIAREANLTEQLAFALNDISELYVMAANPEAAASALRESLELWRTLGNLPMVADNFTRQSIVGLLSGEWDTSLAIAREGDALAESIGNSWGRSNFQGVIANILLERGEIGQALEAFHNAIHFGEEAGYAGAAMYLVALAVLYTHLGLGDRAVEIRQALAARATQYVTEVRLFSALIDTRLHLLAEDFPAAERTVQPIRQMTIEQVVAAGGPTAIQAVLCLVEVALARGDPAAARETAERVLAFQRQGNMRLHLSESLRLLGLALALEGDRVGARTALSEAESEARQIGSRRSLWVILRDRAGIEDLEGNSSDADRLRSEAAEIVDSLSASLPDADTCRSFEAQPEVRLLRTGKSALRMPS